MRPARTKQQSRRPIRKVVLRLFAVVLGLYVLTLAVLFIGQRELVFNTRHSRQATALAHEARTALPVGVSRVALRTKGGDRVAAYFGRALLADGRPDPHYAARPTLLFFYGKGGSLAWERPLLASFRRLDANVLMPDYVGFGLSGGEASEANCYATADACYAYLRGRRDVNQHRIMVAGYSLGSGVAVDLAARELAAHQPVAGLALFAAYTSLADEAHQQYPIYPAALLRVLLRYPFASLQKIGRVTCPVLLVHSRDDRLIPFRMADALAAACAGTVTRLDIRHADHGFYFTDAGRVIYPALALFLERTSSHETHSSRPHPAPYRLRASASVFQAAGRNRPAGCHAHSPIKGSPRGPHARCRDVAGAHRRDGAGA